VSTYILLLISFWLKYWGQFVHLFTKIILHHTRKHLFTNICYIFQSARNLLGIISNKLVPLFSFDAGVDKFGKITLGICA